MIFFQLEKIREKLMKKKPNQKINKFVFYTRADLFVYFAIVFLRKMFTFLINNILIMFTVLTKKNDVKYNEVNHSKKISSFLQNHRLEFLICPTLIFFIYYTKYICILKYYIICCIYILFTIQGHWNGWAKKITFLLLENKNQLIYLIRIESARRY